MDARELRIGNYLMTDDREIVTVLRVDRDGMLVQPVPDEYDGGFHPIPLDEEWLLNFGFKHKCGDVYAKPFGEQEIQVKLYHESNRSGVILKSDELSLGIYGLDYVHKLQNLYYAVMCKELVYTKKG